MSHTPIKSNAKKRLFDFTRACKVNVDPIKFQSSQHLYFAGLNNYILFQKFSYFRWPAWVTVPGDPERAAAFIPLVLINSTMRDCCYFTNFLSREGIFVDPSGMISPSYDHWSVELWVLHGDMVYRAADNLKKVAQDRDTKNSIIHSSWGTGLFTLNQIVYGARSSIDEAIIETQCFLKERKQASLLFVVRPYDLYALGGLRSVAYERDSFCVSIAGRKSICSVSKPDYITAGGGNDGRDIGMAGPEQVRSDSPYGLATLGLGFELKKGENRFIFRIALDRSAGLPAGKYDFSKVKDDFASFAGIKIRNGANIHLPSKLLENWFYGSKISLLNGLPKELVIEGGARGLRTAYFLIYGSNRMGYFNESINYINEMINALSVGEKSLSIDDVTGICYVIAAIADYFIHLRDIEFLRTRFEFIKKKAFLLNGYSAKIRKPGVRNRNTLGDYYIAEEHPHDSILIAFALAQYSYLARCLGIFGDEIKFKKESERIAGIVSESAFNADGGSPDNEFMIFNICAGFPFRIDSISENAIRSLLGSMEGHISEKPFFITSLGWDIFLTFIIANNLIFLKDMRAYGMIDNLLQTKNRRYVLPEYIHPASGRGNWGEGASITVNSMIYATIRNLLFVDYPERLDLFPLPKPQWFEPGNEIRIEDAPSRFGLLTIRVVSTSNEIQIHFEKLPKFVPPDIMINLPMKTRIKHEDDFIVKREDDRSVVINGWPALVRFIRK
ncbi:MAG: hypothetical protein A2W19_16050 [Spirochaetes bacterium RBG_16_49_21]|nr:MAG: hypothetical protein A2W19_16050 [Spirochaetes bacterium RBG_16_49_21]